MKRRIGLDRELTLRWLDIAASLAARTPDKIELRALLMEALADDIPAHFVRYKTCTVLIRTWLSVPPEQGMLRDQALALLQEVALEERMVLHWGMLLLAYPFFRDCTSVIGKTLFAEESVNRKQVSRKIVETWGDRTNVKRSVLRVFQTLADWGVLISDGSECYKARPPRAIHSSGLSLWLAEATLHARQAPIPFSVLTEAPEDFPFRLHLTFAQVSHADRLDSFREGSLLLVALRTPIAGSASGD